jgi:hypothetical protein
MSQRDSLRGLVAKAVAKGPVSSPPTAAVTIHGHRRSPVRQLLH